MFYPFSRKYAHCFLISFWLAFTCFQAVMAASPNPLQWRMTFNDEFTAPPLDKTKWNTTYPYNRRSTPTNAEAEWYMDDAFAFSKGSIRFIAEKRSVGEYHYTSGMLATWDKFAQQYGYFEMRAKLPRVKGLWPAFWLLPADKSWPPEIDIMECLGHQTNVIYMTNHFVDAAKQNSSAGGSYKGPDFSQDYHVYAVDWQPGQITWYIDGIKRFSTTSNVPAVKMYIVANLAVGGYWPGYPDTTTPFPSTMDIDYIRVYQRR